MQCKDISFKYSPTPTLPGLRCDCISFEATPQCKCGPHDGKSTMGVGGGKQRGGAGEKESASHTGKGHIHELLGIAAHVSAKMGSDIHMRDINRVLGCRTHCAGEG